MTNILMNQTLASRRQSPRNIPAGFPSADSIPAHRGKLADVLLAFLVGITFTGYPAFSFLSLLFGIYGDQSRTMTVPYRAAILVLSLTLFAYAWHKGRLLMRTTTHKLFFALWLMYLVRISAETVFYPDRLIFPSYYYWAYSFGVCFGSTLAFMRPLSERTLRLAPWFVWGLALIANLAGLIFRRDEMAIDERLNVTELLNPISYGQCAVALILMSAYLILHVRKTRTMALIAVCAVPGFFVLAITASRSPLLSLLAGMCLVSYHGIKRGANWRTMLGVAVLSVALPIGLGFLFESGSALTNRISLVYEGLQSGGEIDRLILWKSAFGQYLGSPLFGQGLEIIGSGYPHNITVETLMIMGPVGCFLFLWLQFCFLRDVGNLLRVNSAAWIAILAVQYLVLSMFSGAFYCSPEFWGVTLMMAGTAQMQGKRASGPK